VSALPAPEKGPPGRAPSLPGSLVGRGDIRRILVIKWSALGDVVLATAAIEDLYRAFPGADIDLSTTPPWQRLFADDPRFREVFAIDLRGRERGLAGARRFVSRVRKGRYDLVVDLQCNDRSRALLALAQWTGGAIPYRLGLRRQIPYNLGTASGAAGRSAALAAREMLETAGIAARTERPVLHVPERRRSQVRELLAGHGVRPLDYALFLPGSQPAGRLKRWGAARYAALARRLLGTRVSRVVLAGGADEADECRAIAAAAGRGVVDLCGRTEVLDLVPIAAEARFVVANDTGPAHVASAAPRPMVVVCGPTDPARVKPMGDNVVALQAELPCINCYCERPCLHHTCMWLITPAMVEERLAALLDRAR